MNTIKLAFRTLAKTPFLTGVAVFSLALGIGANAAIFSIFDQILLQSLPVHEPDRLVNISAPGLKFGSTSCNSAGSCDVIWSYPMFKDLQEASTGVGLQGIATHRLFGANLATTESTVSGSGVFVSGSYFPLLGVQPALGRLIGPQDDERFGEHTVAVLSHRYWERQLGADPSVLNSTIVVNGRPLTVIGVAQAGFNGTTLGAQIDVFVPVTMREAMSTTWDDFENRRGYSFYLFGRLADGETVERVQEGLNRVHSNILEEVEAPLQEGMSDNQLQQFLGREIVLEEGYQGQSSIQREAGQPLIFLLAVTGVVLIIACANIANLLLARGAGRAREMAIRGSLGASRGQLLGQLLSESIVLAFLGGLASLVVARFTLVGIIRAIPANEMGELTASISPQVIGFTGLVAIATGLVFGLFPALHASRQDLVSMLKSGGGQPSASKAASRFRSTLVTAQIALSLSLLVAAGLFVRSLVNVSQVDLGLDTQNVIAFGLSPALNGYEPERSAQFFPEVERELAAIPGVTDVTAALVPLLIGDNWGNSVQVEGWETGPEIDSGSRYNVVGPGYFSAMGMPLFAGREFTEADADGAPRVAIVNEAFTRKFNLDGRSAVGKFMAEGGDDELDMEIVGVVQDASYSDVKQAVPPLYFVPYAQETWIGFLTFYVRTALEPSEIMTAIPRVIAGMDPNLPVEGITTLEQVTKNNTFGDRIISTLAAAFAILATVLAAIGLYGVLAYSVAQRTREIGVRMALGARTNNVRSMVLKQVSRMTVIGGLIGIAGAFALAQLAQSMLFGMEGMDPWVAVGGSLLLGGVALLAGFLPANKASRVDPIHALRQD